MEHEILRNIVRIGIPFKEPPVIITKEERSIYYSLEKKDLTEFKGMITDMLKQIYLVIPVLQKHIWTLMKENYLRGGQQKNRII